MNTTKTMDPRKLFADDEFTHFRLGLLKEVDRLSVYKSDRVQKEKELKKADDCLKYLMNYRSHQPEW
jgi:hypothetical protein